MSKDPIERKMEFIIEQQAQFAADIMELKARQEQQAAVIEQLTADMVNLKDALLSLTNIVEEHGNQIAALASLGKETDARLNMLITIVERHISDHN
ncbi:MAG TPA: hypothetical protein VNO70_08070 [Blastocatellia bacterium]|nr:hypothetical protein [Blastocatellia bacterium]